MSDTSQDEAVRPIIILKRVEDEHDDHHGGVWKIAFADFMTALMAFFLVMWLINAANEETKAQVASYFNPVKLTDAVLAPKGVKNMDATTSIEVEPEVSEAQGSGPSDDKNTKASKSGAKAADTIGKSDDALFKDPYQTLKAIAGEVGDGPSEDEAFLMTRDKSGSKDADTFRDPFDPEYRSKGTESEVAQADSPEKKPERKVDQKIETFFGEMVVKKPKVPEDTEAKSELKLAEKDKEPTDKDKGEKKTKADDGAKTADKKEAESKPEIAKTKQLERLKALKKQLASAVGKSKQGPLAGLTVEAADGGLMVSLTEGVGFEMFASSSARPTAALIRLIDRISPILEKQNGRIVIRGHTDARPFRSDQYDNWRLSTARAHMARHMLIRGGLEGDRIVRVEGHAAQSLKNKSKPFSAENRRIEVLILDDKI